ncbi:MAG: ComF family protein [Nodosilinea sp.]
MALSFSTKTVWHQSQQQLLNLFLSGHCALCERPTHVVICPSCQRQLRQCQLSNPLESGYAGLSVVSWGRYEGSLRQAIGCFKYNGQPQLAEFLGTELGHTWMQHQARLSLNPTRPITLVPIPLHDTKLHQRGFNQAERVAQWVSRAARLTLNVRGLMRVQATQAQHSLNRADRQKNLAQAFAVCPNQVACLQKTSVWLVDDIFTTGATAQAAALTLRRSGISVAGICTVARALEWDKAKD